MCGFAVHRHENSRAYPGIHALEFTATRMAGNMHKRIIITNQLDTLIDEFVLDVENGFLVTRNRARRENDRVTGRQCDAAHFITRQLRECCTWFTLTARQDHHDIFTRNIAIIIFA
ncbi:hypothetical protein FQZ97_1101530 [compost metagenome]